jgi:hypothetical protein
MSYFSPGPDISMHHKAISGTNVNKESKSKAGAYEVLG